MTTSVIHQSFSYFSASSVPKKGVEKVKKIKVLLLQIYPERYASNPCNPYRIQICNGQG